MLAENLDILEYIKNKPRCIFWAWKRCQRTYGNPASGVGCYGSNPAWAFNIWALAWIPRWLVKLHNFIFMFAFVHLVNVNLHTFVCQFTNQALKCHPSNEFLLHTFLALQICSVLDARKQFVNALILSSHNRLNWFPPPPTTTTVLLLLNYIFVKTLLLDSVYAKIIGHNLEVPHHRHVDVRITV
jgi:hypothetical protein